MDELNHIANHISLVIGEQFKPTSVRSISGGCINTCLQLLGNNRSFLKLNDKSRIDMYNAEAEGLETIVATQTIRAPAPIATGICESKAYLAMEFIDLRSGSTMRAAGTKLAEMHRATQELFGWVRDNTIGTTPQRNNQCEDWCSFWRDNRLSFQLRLAARNGYRGTLQDRGELLITFCSALIDHQPCPSLLHGDLWGGNIGFDRNNNPVIFDPAVYYGDRETDIAMTELFGGFSADFYRAYNEIWPLDPGYRTRKIFYNLYHILNHLNLFGGGYGTQAVGMINRLLAEVGH